MSEHFWEVVAPAVLATVASVVGLWLRFRRKPPAPIPEPRPSQPQLPPASQGAWPRRKALVVEDDPAQLRVLARLLRAELEGVDVEAVASGEEALARLRTERFDLLLADLHLPDMSGAELVRRLRREGSIRPLLPCALLSGLEPESLSAVASECGADAILSKPFDAEQLGELARGLLRMARPG